MASRQKAVNAYRPQLQLGTTVSHAKLAEHIAERTGLSEGQISIVLLELRDAIISFGCAGRGVKLMGVGTFLPSIKLNGQLNMKCRLDPIIRRRINAPNKFQGTIMNAQNIGKPSQDLITQWNQANPDDLVGG